MLAYGTLTVPMAVAGLPVAIFIAPLYSDYVGLPLGTVGLVLMLPRLVELLVDPVIGRISDRTQSRFGRRRPYIVAGIPLMMLATWGVFMPQPGADAISLFCWLTLFYLAWGMITVPYAAWGAELSTDYHERSRVAASRETWSVVGLIAAVLLPVVVGDGGTTGSSAERETASIVAAVAAQGWLTIFTLPLFGILIFTLVPEAKCAPESQARPESRARLIRNAPFVLLFATTAVSALASGINQSTVIHFYRFCARLPQAADALILVYFVAAVVGAGVWAWAAKRFEKARVFVVALSVNAACQLVMLFIPEGHLWGFGLVQVGAGLAYTGPLILGASMAADVADLDHVRGWVQRTGFIIGLLVVVQKACEAVGVGLALSLLGWLGFDLQQGFADQSRAALRTVNIILPSALVTVALIPALFYPLNKARQRRLQRILLRRGRGEGKVGQAYRRRSLTNATGRRWQFQLGSD